MAYATRPCCGSNYGRNHLADCRERGVVALAALPCQISTDGWCESHSTGAGPVYCTTTRAAHTTEPEEHDR